MSQKLTREIEEIFILNDKHYQVIKGYLATQCYHCSLHKKINCWEKPTCDILGYCSEMSRSDKQSVYFKEILNNDI